MSASPAPFQWWVSFDWWMALLFGGIISLVLQIVVTAFLPPTINTTLIYYRKKFWKIFRPPKLDIKLIAKTPSITEKNLSLEEVLKKLEKEFHANGYEPAIQNNDVLVFHVPIGEKKIDVKINAATTMSEKSEKYIEIIDQIQCTFQQRCEYRRLNDDIHQMREAQLKIIEIMRRNVSNFMDSISLECKLKDLYEITSILEKNKIDNASSTIVEGGTRFELFKNQLTVFGKDLNDEVLGVLKQMIISFY